MKKLLSFILCAVLLTAVLPLPVSVYAAESDPEAKMLDEIIIRFFDKSLFPGEDKQYDDEVAKVLKSGLSVVCENTYVINAKDLSKNPNAILNRYKNSKFIKYVEPNYIVDCEVIPNDPNYKTYQSAAMTLINAPAGWDITTGANSTVIAVIDSGVTKHYDLPNTKSGYSSVSTLAPSNDKLGHGTKVAGVIGAMSNTVGGVGINWNASIMSVKVDDANGTISVANLAKGIIWAADNGARVINMSLGTVSDSVTLKNAVDYAYKQGCAMFAATGNESTASICYPARYPNVFAVGGTTNGTSRVSTSNYGPGIDAVAIGTFYTTTASGTYANSVGTSFASPQAAGLASLMLAVNPDLTNDQVYSLIRQGAKPLGGGYNEQTGYGLINIGTTLELAKENAKPQIVKDTTPPVLTLLGNTVMVIEQGKTFTDPGYTAIDDTDGTITDKVAVTGSVDTNVPGVYRLEYTVSDVAGNMSTAVRVVEVIYVDDVPPLLTLKGLQIMAIKQGEAYTEPGYTAIDNIDGDITNRVTITGTVDVNVPGVYKLEYVVYDAAGNRGAATRIVEVMVATEKPEPQYPIDNPPSDITEGEKSFLIEAAVGSRNNYNGSVGYEFECIEDILVSTVGRPLNGTMEYAHTVYIWEAKTMTLLASAEVRPDSPLDNLGFKTARLDKIITLKAGEEYRIVSSETAGGDSWYDVDQAYNLIPNADCRIVTPVFTEEGEHDAYPGNQWNPGGIKGYVGATFYYKLEASVPNEPVTPQKPEYNTPPVITLSGAMEISLFIDEEYIEAGYNAIDCYGVDLTGAVRVTNNINIWSPGFYTINYIVEDAGGNTIRATRTVIVTEREVPPPPIDAPILTITGSDPIILHLGSGTPYTEQGAYAFDEDDGDISANVQITGNVDRNKAGTYTITYKVVNSAGLEAAATRTVRVLAPNEVKPPRQTYNFSGQGKAVTNTTHKNVISEDSGWMDFKVTNLDKNMTIKVEVKNQSSNVVAYSDTYTGVGGKQFWVDEGRYDVNVTIAAANGNGKYGVSLVTPERIYFTFEDEEVPLFDPELIRYFIDEGCTPLEICLSLLIAPEELNDYYWDFIDAGWAMDDLVWFGLDIASPIDLQQIDNNEVPLGSFQETDDAENPAFMILLIVVSLAALVVLLAVIRRKGAVSKK